MRFFDTEPRNLAEFWRGATWDGPTSQTQDGPVLFCAEGKKREFTDAVAARAWRRSATPTQTALEKAVAIAFVVDDASGRRLRLVATALALGFVEFE